MIETEQFFLTDPRLSPSSAGGHSGRGNYGPIIGKDRLNLRREQGVTCSRSAGEAAGQRPGQERVLRHLAALGSIGATSVTVQQLVADGRRSAAIAKKLGRLGHRRVRRAVVQQLLDDRSVYVAMAQPSKLFGDGRAAAVICHELLHSERRGANVP